MLTQGEADDLIMMEKHLVDPSQSIAFPFPGESVTIPLESTDGRERFQLDLARGSLATSWKIQLRNRQMYILVRLDVGGPGHGNPPKAPNPCLR